MMTFASVSNTCAGMLEVGTSSVYGLVTKSLGGITIVVFGLHVLDGEF